MSPDGLIAPPSTPWLAPVELQFTPGLEWLCMNGTYFSIPLPLDLFYELNYAPFNTYLDEDTLDILVIGLVNDLDRDLD